MSSKAMHTISFFLLLMGSLMLLFNLLTVVVPENLTIFNVYCAMTIVFIVMAVFIAGVFFALSRITLSVTHAAIDEEGNKGLAFSLAAGQAVSACGAGRAQAPVLNQEPAYGAAR